MRARLWNTAAAGVLWAGTLLGGSTAHAQALPVATLNPAPVTAALDELDVWLGSGENSARWQAYLKADQLRAELAKGGEADPLVLNQTLTRLAGKANGLQLEPFQKLRKALVVYANEVGASYQGDFAKLAAADVGNYKPLTPEEFAAIRANMRDKAQALVAAMGGNSQLAQNWKKFLLWDQLAPNFADDAEVSRGTLLQLDEVLSRFRANQPGLELPAFTDAARAIAKYRALASWGAASQSRDLRGEYERLLNSLGTELQRHLERPTTETGWKVGRILGVIDNLGHSSDFVQLVRERFAQKNISAQFSVNFVDRMPNRNLDQVRPVRDCILGTSIFGTAHTLGSVRYDLQPADDKIELVVHLDGLAHSQTRGYNGPVVINSQGQTTYTANKRISISDEIFEADPAVANVDTRTHINSIQKTGGQFAAGLITKVAWKRASQSKAQAERISAEHTRQNVIKEFNERVAKDLGDARLRYQQKIRDPLVRRDMFPDTTRLTSSPEGVAADSTFAARNQIAADSPRPPVKPGQDLSLQIHESAVNNYLPIALASARISQETAEQQPILNGNVPNWIKVLSVKKPELAAAVATGAAVVDSASKTLDQVVEGQADERGPNDPPALPPFKPYSITLNSEAPVGVRFDDGKVVIRVRASKLVSDDMEYSNWDFIITYAITQDGDRIVLKRVGDIEVFPTGFDPAWDKQMTAQQSGFRSTLAKNMNARANAGESFPAEIPIDPIRITNVGTLLLDQLEVQDGWLTVGWILPPAGP
ncbi:hypothetical protein [Lacipirellula sp.]|uniref:hypothetical protein n=1 Tax=Lacipirellula sp. TaxID=2691419 RepID=UPI003D0AB4F6